MWKLHFFTMICLSLWVQGAHAKEQAGEIVSVQGMVFIRSDASTGKLPKSPPRAKAGDSVYAGDVINTSSEGAVKILMRDKSLVDIGPSSLFKMDEYLHQHGADRKAKLNLTFGKLRVAVTKKIEGEGHFKVKTKGATMGVRGTEFVVKEDLGEVKQKTEITVVQGKVEVETPPKSDQDQTQKNDNKKLMLTTGTQLTTGENFKADQVPVKLNEEQLKAVVVETKVEDNTFEKTVKVEPLAMNEGGNEGGRFPASLGMMSGEIPQIKIEDIPRPDIIGLPPVENPFTNVRNTMRRLTVKILVGPI